MASLASKGLMRDGAITDEGICALEPYRVKRAIFMAAGFGTRMAPLTLTTPKPLVTVNGQRIIDGLIDACLKAGIEELYVVRGYLAEKFDELLSKYPMVRFVENPLFEEANNVSSILAVCDLLENAYVLEADLLLSNPAIIRAYHYGSEFLAIPVEHTDDWCFEVRDGFIMNQMVGGEACHQMVGISYWDEADGKKLREDVAAAFEMPGGRDLYWEQVPLKVFKDRYKVSVVECSLDDVVEIDTLDELRALDASYAE